MKKMDGLDSTVSSQQKIKIIKALFRFTLIKYSEHENTTSSCSIVTYHNFRSIAFQVSNL